MLQFARVSCAQRKSLDAKIHKGYFMQMQSWMLNNSNQYAIAKIYNSLKILSCTDEYVQLVCASRVCNSCVHLVCVLPSGRMSQKPRATNSYNQPLYPYNQQEPFASSNESKVATLHRTWHRRNKDRLQTLALVVSTRNSMDG